MFGSGTIFNREKQQQQYTNPVSVELPDLIEYNRHDRVLPLKAGKIRALQSGGFLSPFRGRGMEFVEARPYQAGDDIRHMDWRLTARIGKPHTKIFQEERQRSLFLWVDLDRSMFFGTQGAFKSVVAAHAAALIGWNGVRAGDRVGGIISSEEKQVEIRPVQGKKGILLFIRQLVLHPAWNNRFSNGEQTEDKYLRLRRVVKPGSLVFLLSDMRTMTSRDEQHLGQIALHSDVVLCQIYDPLETSLPPSDNYSFTDGNRTVTLYTGNTQLRRQYEQNWELRNEYLQALCVRQGLHLIQLATDDDLVGTMRNGLGGQKVQR